MLARTRTPRRRIAPRALASLLALALWAPSAVASAAGKGAPGYPARVELTGDADLERLAATRVDIDAVFAGWARIYATVDELAKLEARGFRVTRLPDEGRRMAALLRTAPPAPAPEKGGIAAAYHTYATLVAELQQVASDHPSIARVIKLGESVQGRDLLIVKISDNPDVEEDEPEVAYVSTMHGDEVVGQELLLGLIGHLTDNYGVDPRATALVDTTVIWLMPSMNPDGTAAGSRWNTHAVDLNRNFPDQFLDPVNTPAGREPETAAVMGWEQEETVVLSGNMHAGALVVNYPFDGNPQGSSTFSPTPDQNLFVSISRTYADANGPLSASNDHPAWDDGITNGADWYAVNGGMQDWHYVWNGRFDVTLELNTIKWPAATELARLWTDNLESMLAYLERVHQGVRGVVTDAATGLPLAAEVLVEGNSFPVHTDPGAGDYHRMLLPGTYDLRVDAPGYSTGLVQDVAVGSGPAVRRDVLLVPLPVELRATGASVLDAGGNASLDPGETADLDLSLVNLGHAVSSVTGRLVPTGWFGRVTRAEATYPGIATGETVASIAPHHGVALDPAVPAGHKVGFALRWEADGSSGLTAPLFLDVGPPACQTFAATDLPAAIADFQTTTSELAVPDAIEIVEVRVSVEIRHTFIGDLIVTLRSPSGTAVRLHNQLGGGTDDIVANYPLDRPPVDSLDVLAGENAAGTWALDVNDQGPSDTGTVEAFSVEICGRPVEATTPEMRFADLVAGPEGVLLGWWPYPGLHGYRVYRSTDPSSAAAFADVTAEDDDPADTRFLDTGDEPLVFWIVTGVGPRGEGPKGHFGE